MPWNPGQPVPPATDPNWVDWFLHPAGGNGGAAPATGAPGAPPVAPGNSATAPAPKSTVDRNFTAENITKERATQLATGRYIEDPAQRGFWRAGEATYVNPQTREIWNQDASSGLWSTSGFRMSATDFQAVAAGQAPAARATLGGSAAVPGMLAPGTAGGGFWTTQAGFNRDAQAAGGRIPGGDLVPLDRGLKTLPNFGYEGPNTYNLNQYDPMTRGGPGRAGFTNLIGGWAERTGGGSPFAPFDRRMFSDSYLVEPTGYGGPGGQDFYYNGEPSVSTSYMGGPATLSTGTAGAEIRGGALGGWGGDVGAILGAHGIAPSGDPLIDAARAAEIAESQGQFSFARGGTLGVGRPGSSDPTIIGRTPGTGIPSPPNTGSLTPGPGPGGYTLFSQAAPVPDPVEPVPVAPPPIPAPTLPGPPIGGGGMPGSPYYPPGWGPTGPLGPPVSGVPLPTPTAPLPTPVGPPALPPAPPPVSDYGAAAQNADYQQNLFGYRRAAGALPGMQAIQLAAGEVPTGPAPAGYYYRPYDEAASQRNQLEAWKQAPFGVNLSNYKQGLSAPFDLLMQAYMNQTNAVNQAPFNLAFGNYMNQQRDVTSAPWDLLMQEWYRSQQAPTVGTSYGSPISWYNPNYLPTPSHFVAGGSLGYGAPVINEGPDGIGGRKSMVVPERSLIVGTQTGTPYGEMSEAGAELLTDTGNRLRIDPMGGMGGGGAGVGVGAGATPPTRLGTLPNVTPQEFSYLLKAAPDVATSLAQLDLALMRTGNAPTAQMEMALGKAEGIADPNVRQRALGTYRNIVSRVNSMRMQPPDLSMPALPEDPVALAALAKFANIPI